MIDDLQNQPRATPRIYASVTLWGDVDHAVVTEAMGVAPHHSAYKGEVKRSGAPPVKQTYWAWRTEEQHSCDGGAILSVALEWLEQRRTSVGTLQADNDMTVIVSLVGYLEPHHSVPAVYLDSAVLRRFAELGVGLEFDFTLLTD